MTAEKTYQSLRADVSSRIEQKLKELLALTADDIIDMYKAEAEKLSVLDGKYPGTGGIRTFITGRDKFTYDFIDLDKYYIKDEVDEMLAEEKKEREEADDDLDKRMTDWEERLLKEIDDRIAGDEDLQNQLDAEIERAKEAEADLQQQIYDETARAKGVEEDLQQQITDEIARAKEAEADLLDQLNKEIERATGVEEDLQDQLDKEIDRAKEAEETEVSERENADNRLVNWAKSHFMDTLITVGHAPLTLTVSYDYDSDGYKVYSIDGTVDCYSKGEINELVDNLLQADSLLQSNIDNVLSVLRSDIDNVQSGVTDLSNSIQGQLNTITSNYVVTIGTNCTYPLTLTTDKNGNNYTISGHVDCYSKDEVDSLINGVSSSLGDYYTKSEVDDLISSVKSSIPSQGITSVTANSSSSILTASSSTNNGSATITYGISDSDLKDWLDNNGYGGGGSTTSGVSSVQITSDSLTVEPTDARSGNVVINLEYTGEGGGVNLDDYYTKEEINDLLDQIEAGDVDLSGYQKKLNYYHENVDETSDVIFAHITANTTTYTLSDGTSVTSPNLAQYRLQYMKSGYSLKGDNVWWTTDYEGEEVTVLQLVVKCLNETKQPRTVFNAYPDFFEWTVDQEYGSDYTQKLVLDRNGLWLNNVKLGAGGGVDLLWYSESDYIAQISVGDGYHNATIQVEQSFDGIPNINLNAEAGTINCFADSFSCSAGSFTYNDCEVATQCWVQDYVASVSPSGESVYPTVNTSIPTSVTLDGNKLYTGSISSNTEIAFYTTNSVAGAEVQIIIEAKLAATVSFTGSSAVFTDGYSSIDVASGKYLEINAIYDGSKIYVRSGYSE